MTEHGRGRVPGLDRRTALQLRRGVYPIDAQLDLHGLTKDGAYRALLDFIADSHAKGRRCVLIITGKGRRVAENGSDLMPREIGILRRMVPGWLADAAISEMVIVHSPATRAHGGDGALYALLRRRREQ